MSATPCTRDEELAGCRAAVQTAKDLQAIWGDLERLLKHLDDRDPSQRAHAVTQVRYGVRGLANALQPLVDDQAQKAEQRIAELEALDRG